MTCNLKSVFSLILSLSISFSLLFAQSTSNNKNEVAKSENIWSPDNGNGTYKNPIIYADYSDPDVIRVDDDYYMTSSSFSNFPGLPILHSKDLVNWKIISHAAIEYPIKEFEMPQHGGGIWAPSLRFHNGEFYIYFGDPDSGIFMTKSKNAVGPWEPLKLIREAKGWIDPCPLWDDDGSVYLVHAWARSRSGIKHKLTLNKMNNEGTKILDNGTDIFCDSVKYPTLEGPKFYKRNGYYYIFAPAGGVKPGWQTVLRSKNIYGPYEDKIVLEQGNTKINGPHQGGWLQTKSGEDWFVHFQDRYAYGRIVHLQPMKWKDDPDSSEAGWPVMGIDYDGNGIGEPVPQCKKPNIGKNFPASTPQTSDEFDSVKLGMQWQCQANFNNDWFSLEERKCWLRIYSQSFSVEEKNLWNAPFLLMQKFPASKFSATIKLEFTPKNIGEKTGLIIFGTDYAYIGIEKSSTGLKLVYNICMQADKGEKEKLIERFDLDRSELFLRVDIFPETMDEIIPKIFCSFSYSVDGKDFEYVGDKFIAKEGKWIGAKVGLFSILPQNSKKNGYTEFDWIKFTNTSVN